jgi:hypothetical protein
MMDIHWAGLMLVCLICFVVGYYVGGGLRR